jgi:alkylation response protein AidB-like acyl-CoA dehydrogenase
MMALIEQGLQPEDFTSTAARAVGACAGLSPREQAARLAGDGLLGVVAPEDVGGLGLPVSFAVPVVAAANAGLLEFPILETIVLSRCLRGSMPRIAEAVVTAKALATIAWNGAVVAERRGTETVVLSGSLARAPCAADVDHVLVRVGESAAALVPLGAEGVSVETASGLDLTAPEHGMHLDNVLLSRDCLLPEGAWTELNADATILRAAAILGSAETCLGLAQEHASTRRQFGHALSYNQAIRHALARHKLGLESVRHAITRALGDEASARERDAAFLAASTYGASICEGAVQIYGGMGFTWDVPLHRHLRRIRSLQVQGNASGTLAALGRRFVAEVAPAIEITASRKRGLGI